MREPAPVVVPQMNPNDEHAVLIQWHVQSGALVAADQVLVTLETTKAAFDVDAPREGFVHFELPPRTMVAVGSAIAWVSDEAAPPAQAIAPGGTAPNAAPASGDERVTRKALRLMKQHGLTLEDFGGAVRVEVEHVERLLQARSAAQVVGSDAEEFAQPPSKMLEAARLSAVYREVVPSTVAVAVSSSRLNKRLAQLAAEHGPLSVLEVVIHELLRLLPEHPELNGYFLNGRAWRYRKAVVGFAINLGRGLKVPVVDPAATTPIEVARSVRDLSLRYMRGELAMQDVVGSTFTVTDLSSHGVVHFIPILNDRQAAILGICAERPGTDSRDFVLTFDHRIADGMQAAALLAALRDAMEGAVS
jgi:pyruvate/2-oxoglutarate dehydrogenase complex dihydrolipoamide acyltransferase (E2) component